MRYKCTSTSASTTYTEKKQHWKNFVFTKKTTLSLFDGTIKIIESCLENVSHGPVFVRVDCTLYKNIQFRNSLTEFAWSRFLSLYSSLSFSRSVCSAYIAFCGRIKIFFIPQSFSFFTAQANVLANVHFIQLQFFFRFALSLYYIQIKTKQHTMKSNF